MPLNVNTAHRTIFKAFSSQTRFHCHNEEKHVQRGSVSLKMCFSNNAFSPYRDLVILRPKDEVRRKV